MPLSQITDTLGVYMGSSYVNDFDFNNRSYRVYVQADKQFRATAQDMKQFYVRSDSGAMVPLENLISIEQTTTPQVISHYNLFRSAEIDGSPAPGYSSGQAIATMEQLASKMPQGFSYSWTGLSLEELAAGGTSLILFGLGTLVVYLTLSAQYESFVLPFIVLLAVPMALLGALGAQWLRGLQNDVFCQVGLVMLVGLSSKNAILDRGICRTIARTGCSAGRVGDTGGDNPVAADSDDFAGIHFGSGAAGGCERRRRERPALRGNNRLWRDDHVHDSQFVFYPSFVPDHRRMAGARKEGTRHTGEANSFSVLTLKTAIPRLVHLENVASVPLSLIFLAWLKLCLPVPA